MDDLWVWTRFYAESAEDWRPIYDKDKGHPGLGPYWCSGYAFDPDRAIIVAYLRPDTDVTLYWPEASDIDRDERHGPIQFSERFPEPEWWATSPENRDRKLP